MRYLDAIGPANATALPGVIVIADKATDDLLGTLVLGRRAAELPGLVTKDGGELELSYVLRRSAWGGGLAFEAATALLRAAADELPDQPVIIVAQRANERSLRLASGVPVGRYLRPVRRRADSRPGRSALVQSLTDGEDRSPTSTLIDIAEATGTR